MKTVFLKIFLLIGFVAFSQQITFKESIEKAKVEHKKVLLYFSGSDWCAPCVKFKKQYIETTQFKELSDILIVYNADFPRQKKNKLSTEVTIENEKLADEYNKNGNFPMIILFNEEGKILKKWEQLPQETLDVFISEIIKQ